MFKGGTVGLSRVPDVALAVQSLREQMMCRRCRRRDRETGADDRFRFGEMTLLGVQRCKRGISA